MGKPASTPAVRQPEAGSARNPVLPVSQATGQRKNTWLCFVTSTVVGWAGVCAAAGPALCWLKRQCGWWGVGDPVFWCLAEELMPPVTRGLCSILPVIPALTSETATS